MASRLIMFTTTLIVIIFLIALSPDDLRTKGTDSILSSIKGSSTYFTFY
ncbi:hypothetical protein [Bacillus cereus]